MMVENVAREKFRDYIATLEDLSHNPLFSERDRFWKSALSKAWEFLAKKKSSSIKMGSKNKITRYN